MNLLRFVATLLLISIPCLAQQVDYRALGTNSFFTNSLRVDSKHWTNAPVGIATVIRPVDTTRTIYNDNSGPNYQGLSVSLFNTGVDTFTLGGYLFNSSTNSGVKAPYYSDGAYGGIFEVAPSLTGLKNGDGVGALGVADGFWSRQVGLSGLAVAVTNNQTNIAVYGSALSAGKTGGARVGGYFETGDQTQGTVTDPVITNSVIQANSRSGDFIFRGQTNGQSTVQVRADGSVFVGPGISQIINMNNFNTLYFPYAVSMTESNEPSIVEAVWMAMDSGDSFSVYSKAGLEVDKGVNAAFNLFVDSGPEIRNLNFGAVVGSHMMDYASNSVPRFRVNEGGDLTVIKGVDYSWPIGYGSESNYVLTMTNNTGALDWQPGLLSPTGTNIILSIASNAVSGGSASIGPGTNNWIAKFNSTGTNAINSSLFSDRTNLVELRQRPDGGDFNSAFTNNIFGRETVGGDTNWLQIIAGAAGVSQVSHIRAMATGAASQRLGIYLNDSWIFEPNANALAGHGAGSLNPTVDDTFRIGDLNQPLSIDIGTGYIAMGIPASTSFPGIRIGSSDCGISSRGANDLSFWRPVTGITAAFDRERRSGSLQFDLAGNYLAFGVGISNTVAFLGGNDQVISALGLLGVVQVGTNNNTAGVVPLSVGFIGAPGVGADRHGTDIKIIGGPSSGTGTNGNVRLQTSEKALATSSTINSNQKDRLHIIADPIILTTNAATTVFSFTVPTTLKAAGITVFAHTEIENGVDIAVTDETFLVNANNKAGTVVASTPSAPLSTTSSSGGSAAIANTWSTSVTGTRVDVQLTCVTSGILSTNSTCRVTLVPNSSAIPVITHP